MMAFEISMATAVNDESDRGASDGIECGTRELRMYYVLRSQSSGERSLVSDALHEETANIFDNAFAVGI
jgi:hypothetical protein